MNRILTAILLCHGRIFDRMRSRSRVGRWVLEQKQDSQKLPYLVIKLHDSAVLPQKEAENSPSETL